MKAANEAVKEFTEKAIAKIKEIIEISKNKVSDAVSAVIIFCKKMAEVAKKALEKIGEGVVIAFSLPFLFAFAVYKGTLKICEAIVEKVKDGAKVVKEAFVKVKNTIVGWATDMLKKAKDVLKKACDAVKDGAAAAYKAIGKTFLAIVAILGQLASDAKDAIKEAYNSFVEGVKEFADEVKAYVKEKWDVVANWCKKTSTAFAEGVKNVWDKMKEKVTAAVGAVKDAYQTLKDNAKATWDEIKKWNDERQQEDIKAKMKYAADKWGKDKVSSWIDEL
jgi:phage-related protein